MKSFSREANVVSLTTEPKWSKFIFRRWRAWLIPEVLRQREFVLLLGLLAFLVLLGGFSMLWGQYHVPLRTWLHLFSGSWQNSTPDIVLLQIRLPRVILAALIGGGLAVSGAAYQGLFNNPMVSPEILGASSGAGFGAAIGILLSQTIVTTQILAFVMGLCAVLLVWLLAFRWSRSGDPILVLVLVVSGF